MLCISTLLYYCVHNGDVLIWKRLYDLDAIFVKDETSSRFNGKERIALKKFSFAVAILALIPLLLILIFTLFAGIRFGYIGIEKSLLILLISFIALYFLLPMLARNILSQLVSLKPKAKQNEGV